MQLALREAESLARNRRSGRNHECTGLRAADGLDRALPKLRAKNVLARRRGTGRRRKGLVLALGPLGNLNR